MEIICEDEYSRRYSIGLMNLLGICWTVVFFFFFYCAFLSAFGDFTKNLRLYIHESFFDVISAVEIFTGNLHFSSFFSENFQICRVSCAFLTLTFSEFRAQENLWFSASTLLLSFTVSQLSFLVAIDVRWSRSSVVRSSARHALNLIDLLTNIKKLNK